jgi:hypothetical protein
MAHFNKFILGGVAISLFFIHSFAGAHQKNKSGGERGSDTEIIWKSNRMDTSWFGQVHKVRLGQHAVEADWVVLKVGQRSDIKVDEIKVRYLDKHHDHPKTLRLHPYQRIRNGDRVRFRLHRTRRVIGVQVKITGWSGSHAVDHFRVLLAKNVHRPERGWVQTEYFYGKCIGGLHCPGYRRNAIQKFSIDLEGEMDIRRIQFDAHDGIGNRHQAAVNIYVDGHQVARGIDMKKRGSVNTVDLQRVYGRYITFEAANNDEAMIQEIVVNFSAYWDRKLRKSDGHRQHHGGDGGHDNRRGREHR